MIVKRNKQGTFDLTGVSIGKLLAIVSAIEKIEKPSPVQMDIKNLIRNNPDFKESTNF